ncbi:MAG: hypothetical protein JWM17_1876, partial [Actinobacteria bacterium]|nr:hypothetical protein [Actinomycetota bacterium]
MVPSRPSSEEAFTEFEQCSVPGSTRAFLSRKSLSRPGTGDPGFTWRVYRHRFERRTEEGPSDAAVALENVWAKGLSPRQPGGQRGDRRSLRVVPGLTSWG